MLIILMDFLNIHFCSPHISNLCFLISRSFPKYNIIKINQNTKDQSNIWWQNYFLKPGQKKTKIIHLLVSFLGSIQLITHGIKPIPIPLPNIKIHSLFHPQVPHEPSLLHNHGPAPQAKSWLPPPHHPGGSLLSSHSSTPKILIK